MHGPTLARGYAPDNPRAVFRALLSMKRTMLTGNTLANNLGFGID
jgi:hypothetical protein